MPLFLTVPHIALSQNSPGSGCSLVCSLTVLTPTLFFYDWNAPETDLLKQKREDPGFALHRQRAGSGKRGTLFVFSLFISCLSIFILQQSFGPSIPNTQALLATLCDLPSFAWTSSVTLGKGINLSASTAC